MAWCCNNSCLKINQFPRIVPFKFSTMSMFSVILKSEIFDKMTTIVVRQEWGHLESQLHSSTMIYAPCVCVSSKMNNKKKKEKRNGLLYHALELSTEFPASYVSFYFFAFIFWVLFSMSIPYLIIIFFFFLINHICLRNLFSNLFYFNQITISIFFRYCNTNKNEKRINSICICALFFFYRY